MCRHRQRKGGWPPGEAKRRDHHGQRGPAYHRGGTGPQPAAGAVTATPAAEPGTNPQPSRRAHGKSREIAKGFTREAFQALAAVMQDQEAAGTARVNAANTILEWGHGKRGEAAKAAKVIRKVLKVDWGKE
jgi:hypothetical protein